MTVGGTDWGFNPAPFMYTSYDYGSPISEPGTLSFKYPELKLVGEMSQALPDLTETDQVTPPSIAGLTTFEERNPRPGRRSCTSATTAPRRSRPRCPTTPSATVTVPAHEAKFLVSDARFGRQHLVSTTSELVTQMTLGRRDVALLDGNAGSAGETSLSYAHRPSVRVLANPLGLADPRRRGVTSAHVLTLHYTHDGLSEVAIGAGHARLLLLLADTTPPGSSGSSTPPAVRCWCRARAAAHGCRSAAAGLSLTGDTARRGSAAGLGARRVSGSVSWDGRPLTVDRGPSRRAGRGRFPGRPARCPCRRSAGLALCVRVAPSGCRASTTAAGRSPTTRSPTTRSSRRATPGAVRPGLRLRARLCLVPGPLHRHRQRDRRSR